MNYLANSAEVRPYLYLLGFFANLLFWRAFSSTVDSKRKKGRKQSLLALFGVYSGCANVLMCLHGYIQLQYPICIIQALNALIAWRNLNLMERKVCQLKTVLSLMILSLLALSICFFLQGNSEWMRAPTLPWSGKHASHAALSWHILGFFWHAPFREPLLALNGGLQKSIGKVFWDALFGGFHL